jgi:hypothetical protein
MLRQLGNSFIVQPDVLRSYLSEAHLGKVDARLLRPYLAQRSDYSSFSRRFLEDEGLAVQDVPPTDDGSKHGLSRGSRLSIGAGSGMSRLRELLKAVDEHAFGHERRSEKHDSHNAVKDGPQSNPTETVHPRPTRASQQPQVKHSGVVIPIAY